MNQCQYFLDAGRLFVLAIAFCWQAFALPTMVRLGYPNCVSCHVSPQGGGLLNQYGRSIDQAQSLAGGEYSPWNAAWVKALNWDGWINQDFRSVLQQTDTSTTDKPGTQVFRSRVIYRNATELGGGFRLTFTGTGENQSALRPSLAYDTPASAPTFFVNTALLSYRANEKLEVAVGRDQLPTGLNIADLGVFVRSRNRLGYYDAPTQIKAFIGGSRYLITPYAFGPGGNEAPGFREAGGGFLAEFDVLGKRKTIAGVNFVRGAASLGDRVMIGPYARLGFGKWGILAEHDMTSRSMKTATPVSFWQATSYGQLFWAVREWLVPSLIVERLQVDRPYRENLRAVKLEVSARISPQFTVSVGPRLQHDEVTGRTSRSVVFQIAMKTAR